MQQQNDKDDEESMSTSEAGSNSQNSNSDEESSVSFETVEEKDTGFSSKRNIEREDEEPANKKQRQRRATVLIWSS